ncbi:MAG TPA: M14 family metallopeptidase [Salinivirgaceae bacterium]|nr:M14 family metallopeptidase [Salinivirgaceae bacterium]
MKNYFAPLIFLLATLSCTVNSGKKLPETPFEQSNGQETATYEQTIQLCEAFSSLSSQVQLKYIGKSAQGRPIPVLIVDKNKQFTPQEVRKSGKTVLLIQANIHPGEPDGNDAGMLLLKKMISEKRFPDHVTILFLPVFNPDGLARFNAYNRINQNGPKAMGWRTTAQNLNLNRDFVKAESPEMQAWLTFFHQWFPDMTIDCHVTDGADYQYVMTYVLHTYTPENSSLTQWKNNYLNFLTNTMDSSGFPMFPYVTFRNWHDPRSGIYSRPPRPLLSNGYVSVLNRIGLLLEAHSLKPFQQRVEATLACLENTIDFLEKNHRSLLQAIATADKETVNLDSIPLTFKTSPRCDTIDFKGVEYSPITSSITGGQWFRYNPDQPKTFRIPYFSHIEPERIINIPEGYIFGPEWQFLKDRLDWHKIEYFQLQSDICLSTKIWRLTGVEWNPQPFEGRFWLKKIDIHPDSSITTWPKGSIVVPTRQQKLPLIVYMFEPYSPDSYLQNGFFNAIFERKEYFETYVMEPMAAAMFDSIPGLKEQFEQWKSENPNADQYKQLEWFYAKTPYYDNKLNLYPVGAIDKKELNKLLINKK